MLFSLCIVMQSIDFDISVIEKLFFKTSSPPSATSSDQLSAKTDVADVAAKRVPLYERKPSDEWVRSHLVPSPLTSAKDATVSTVELSTSSSNSSSSTTQPDDGNSSVSSAAGGSLLFDPPKPDTPPSNVPFWMDPVWRHDSPSAVAATATPLEESVRYLRIYFRHGTFYP